MQPHVGIVGAGISGLRCADILLEHGFEVTILEARDRIGGRICQSDDLGYTVDIGPNWIHTWNSGEVHPIWKLAVETETPLHHWNSKQLIYNSSGTLLPDDKADKLSTLLWKIIAEAFEVSAAARERDRGRSIPSQQSLYDYVKKRVADELDDDEERQTLVRMSEMWGAYVGEPVWRQSLRFAWMEECCGGEEMFVASNYSAILDKVSQRARDEAQIILGTRITSVQTPEQRDSAQNKVYLVADDGREFAFDEVVMTTPLGWLQRHHQETFTPPLPPRITSAITSLKLSQLEKVFITFPRAFWIRDGERPDEFPSYTNWLTPAYAGDTNHEGWPQEIWNLAAFAAPNDHPTILFYLYGDCSRYVVNSIFGKTKEEKFDFLNAFFHPYYSRLPGFVKIDENDGVETSKEGQRKGAGEAGCSPRSILATEWLRDDLCGNGSYCNFQVGVEEADKDVLALRRGCEARRLWFCGEHAAPFEECGTVAGAYLSGESLAKTIVRVYHKEGKESDRGGRVE